jgi:beta-phosphoglucomutase-like phosphatase (HAD superfamily)
VCKAFVTEIFKNSHLFRVVMEMLYDIVLLDNDGTLVDSVHRLIDIDCDIVNEITGKKPTHEEFHRVMRSVREFSDAFRHFGIKDVDNAYRIFHERENALDNFVAVDGAKEFSEFLTANGIKKQIITYNRSMDNVHRKLRSSGLLDYFPNGSITLSTDSKAATITDILKNKDIHPSRAIFYTDWVRDIEQGKMAGVDTVALLNPATSYNTIEELLSSNPTYKIWDLKSAKALLYGN